MNKKKLEILATVASVGFSIASTLVGNWIVKNEIQKQVHKN